MKTIYKIVVGSQAYGTNTPTSDIDIKGIYQQSQLELLGFGYKEQYEANKDEVYFEIKRFLELLETANPTILEMLYSPEDCIIIKDPILDILFKNRDKFLTKKCRMSFGEYAVQQIKKARGLDKKQNWEAARVQKKEPIDFCYVVLDSNNKIDGTRLGTYPLRDWLRKNNLQEKNVFLNKLNHTAEGYQLFLSYTLNGIDYGDGIMTKDNARLKTISSPVTSAPIATVLYNADAYDQHKRDFHAYETWLKERNPARYSDFKEHGQKIDGKNLLHCRRLLDVAMEIATERTINVRRPNAKYLLSIRKGEVSLDDILTQAEEDIEKMDELFDKSNLPDRVDPKLKEEILLTIRGVI